MRAVLDASVAVSYVRPEIASSAVRRWLGRWLLSGGSLVVPHHFWLEVINALARRHRWSGASILEALRELRELSVESVELDEAAHILVVDAAERYGLSAYDAQYVALAEQLDLPLVTFDRPLAAAAGSRWIDPVESSHRLSETPAPYGSPPRVTWPDYSGAASYLASLRANLKRAEAKRGAERARAR